MSVGGGAAVKMQHSKESKFDYTDTRSLTGKDRDDFIEHNMWRIEVVAHKILKSLPLSAQVSVEDLISEGVIGLLEAMSKYDPAQGKKFSTFSESRIVGSILDYLRRKDHLSVQSRRFTKQIREFLKQNDERMNRGEPVLTDEEIAAKLGINNMKDYFFYKEQVGISGPVSLTGILQMKSSNTLDSEKFVMSHNKSDVLHDAFFNFVSNIDPEKREKYTRIFEKYFIKGSKCKEIGEQEQVEGNKKLTEGRINQILKEITDGMREYMEKNDIKYRDLLD
jgi:RNA polymerase sigma factor for flagellar operon FliA